ncbi:hypothetical protein SAMN02910264_01600 [Ruminococcaceae bacterium YAD3003]|nr:hypothetical protein SAMN02910264_01600 [Ruminococcaceae bacterium YAD3003]
MKAKLVGIQPIHFTNNSGEEIIGTSVYCLSEDENVEGLRADKFFLKDSQKLPAGVQVNDLLELSFNMKGKIEKIEKSK